MATREQSVRVPEETVAQWSSRLLPYRRYVLLTWHSLSFTSSPLSAVAVWAPVHLTIGLLFAEEVPLAAMLGNFLLMIPLFYTLVRFAAHFRGPSQWTTEQEDQYRSMCGHLAFLEVVIRHLTGQLMNRRKTDPWKFYLVSLAVALFVWEIGRWISTGLFMQMLASLFLLLPVALEHDWLKEDHHHLVRPAWQRFRESVVTLGRYYWREARSRVERYRAQRQRHSTSK